MEQRVPSLCRRRRQPRRGLRVAASIRIGDVRAVLCASRPDRSVRELCGHGLHGQLRLRRGWTLLRPLRRGVRPDPGPGVCGPAAPSLLGQHGAVGGSLGDRIPRPPAPKASIKDVLEHVALVRRLLTHTYRTKLKQRSLSPCQRFQVTRLKAFEEFTALRLEPHLGLQRQPAVFGLSGKRANRSLIFAVVWSSRWPQKQCFPVACPCGTQRSDRRPTQIA